MTGSNNGDTGKCARESKTSTLWRACENKTNFSSKRVHMHIPLSGPSLRLIELFRVCFALAHVMWGNGILAKGYCRDYMLGTYIGRRRSMETMPRVLCVENPYPYVRRGKLKLMSEDLAKHMYPSNFST